MMDTALFRGKVLTEMTRLAAAARSTFTAGAVLFLAACDGGPLVGKAPPTFTVVSGDAREGVANARVVVDGLEHRADARGRLFLDTPALGAPIEIFAPGFLDRRTTFGRVDASGHLTLWPTAGPSGITEQYVREAVYTSAAAGVANPAPGGQTLARWSPSIKNVRVVLLGPDDNPQYIEFNDGDMAGLRRTVADMNAAMNGLMVYAEPEPGDNVAVPATVRLRIWPQDPNCVAFSPRALTQVNSRNISSAIVTFCNANNVSLGTPLHELGHTFGFSHSTSRDDLMGVLPRRTELFSARERLAMTLMMQRTFGNRFPDDDRSTTVSASSVSAGPPIEFVCY